MRPVNWTRLGKMCAWPQALRWDSATRQKNAYTKPSKREHRGQSHNARSAHLGKYRSKRSRMCKDASSIFVRHSAVLARGSIRSVSRAASATSRRVSSRSNYQPQLKSEGTRARLQPAQAQGPFPSMGWAPRCNATDHHVHAGNDTRGMAAHAGMYTYSRELSPVRVSIPNCCDWAVASGGLATRKRRAAKPHAYLSMGRYVTTCAYTHTTLLCVRLRCIPRPIDCCRS